MHSGIASDWLKLNDENDQINCVVSNSATLAVLWWKYPAAALNWPPRVPSVACVCARLSFEAHSETQKDQKFHFMKTHRRDQWHKERCACIFLIDSPTACVEWSFVLRRGSTKKIKSQKIFNWKKKMTFHQTVEQFYFRGHTKTYDLWFLLFESFVLIDNRCDLCLSISVTGSTDQASS